MVTQFWTWKNNNIILLAFNISFLTKKVIRQNFFCWYFIWRFILTCIYHWNFFFRWPTMIQRWHDCEHNNKLVTEFNMIQHNVKVILKITIKNNKQTLITGHKSTYSLNNQFCWKWQYPGWVKPKTIKLVFVASPLSMQH